jgi:ornithine carbamoyltransferase
MNHKDFISIKDFSPAEIQYLLILGRQVKTHPTTYCDALKRKTLAMIFEKPSLRTRVSFDVGIQQLGGFSLYLSPNEISLGKRESVYDVAKNLERMVQGIMIRTFAHEIVEEMAQTANIPVINALTDFCHPCQAMADYLTMWEIKGNLEGLKVAFVGDGDNVAHALMFAGAQVGAHVWVASPRGFEPNGAAVKWSVERGEETGGTCHVVNDPTEAVAGADVVYTDVWTSMGQEAEGEKRDKAFTGYQVNMQLMRKAKKDAIFMHCLPAHRGKEVTDEVIDSPQSVVFQQAENRLHAQKAIMLELMKGEFVKLPGLVELQELVHV